MYRYSQNIIYLILIGVGITILLFIGLADEALVTRITTEDGLVETLSATFYLIGSFTCVFHLFRKKSVHRFWMIFWCLFCLFCLGEEISWFQRILKYDTPALVEGANRQNEFNIHNLFFLHGGKWIDALQSGEFDLKLLFSSQNMFRAGFFIYFLIIPLSLKSGRLQFIVAKWRYPSPNGAFLIAAWMILGFSFVLSGFSSDPVKSSLAETREFFYAFFIMLYLFLMPTFMKQNLSNLHGGE